MSAARRDQRTRRQGDNGTAHAPAGRPPVSLSPCLLVVLSLLLPAAAGCNIIGALAYKATGDPTIKARYPLGDKPTLVMVENFHNPGALREESDAVARHLAEELKMHDAGPVVPPNAAEAYRQAQGEAFRRMPVDAIGRATGAGQVIYVDLEAFEVTQALASDMLGGRAEARVRVVDESGATLWPTDSAAGFPVQVQVHPQRLAPGTDEFGARRALHAKLADHIARLFYDWKGESSDGAAERFSG